MKSVISFIIICCLTVQISAQNDFTTLFERSGYISTDDYNNTIKYFRKLSENSNYAELHEFGESPQGRKLYYLIVDKEGDFEAHPDLTKRTKPVIMIQNGIHSGEIEGKDACMLLLKEILITKEKEYLINNSRLIIIPVFNVDGHERRSRYNRINQNGPEEMGWRTTAQNFNLNRDYMKADTPEMRALLKLFTQFNPDIFIDTHTTDGADYQYTITYGIDDHLLKYEPQREWVKSVLRPKVEKSVEDDGFLIFPYVSYIEGDFRNGVKDWISIPRFSHGYAAMKNRIGILIETHMLKPYKERVFSTKSFLNSVIEIANENREIIISNSLQADEYVSEYYLKHDYPFQFKIIEKADTVLYKGKKPYFDSSFIAGAKIKKYLQEPLNLKVPYFHYSMPVKFVRVPSLYLIPREYSHLVEIMKLHGIKVDSLDNKEEFDGVETLFNNVKFASFPYEGHFSPKFTYENKEAKIIGNKGDFLINPHQPNIGIILYLLEPDSPDSFLKWGLFNNIFEQKEYFEAYSMEPIAKKMYSENEELRNEFNRLIKTDSTFAASPRKRLNFFYKHSPYFDKKLNVYPVIKVFN